MIVGLSDYDKVRVEICKIENGYLVSRQWYEKSEPEKRKDVCCGPMGEHKEETYYLKELPSELAKMFVHGNTQSVFGGRQKTNEDEDVFKKASNKYLKGQ